MNEDDHGVKSWYKVAKDGRIIDSKGREVNNRFEQNFLSEVNKRTSSFTSSVLLALAGLTITNILFWSLRESEYASNERTYLFSEVQKRADMDRNGFIDDEEWREVYESIGRKYDARNTNPFTDLTDKEILKYISSHR